MRHLFVAVRVGIARVKPTWASYEPTSAEWTAQLTASTFNRLCQQYCVLVTGVYSYAEPVASLGYVGVTRGGVTRPPPRPTPSDATGSE